MLIRLPQKLQKLRKIRDSVYVKTTLQTNALKKYYIKIEVEKKDVMIKGNLMRL